MTPIRTILLFEILLTCAFHAMAQEPCNRNIEPLGRLLDLRASGLDSLRAGRREV